MCQNACRDCFDEYQRFSKQNDDDDGSGKHDYDDDDEWVNMGNEILELPQTGRNFEGNSHYKLFPISQIKE